MNFQQKRQYYGGKDSLAILFDKMPLRERNQGDKNESRESKD
jgi:hypothetical protein